ncbi:unnamed protein product, partial [marine sediment metagenome]
FHLLQVALIYGDSEDALLKVAAGIHEGSCNKGLKVFDEIEEDSLILVGAIFGLESAEVFAGDYRDIGHHSCLLKPVDVFAGGDIELHLVVARFEAKSHLVEGGIVFAAIMEAVGTSPFPNTKQCRCPLCHHLQTVKVGTTIIVCANCGKTYFVQDFSKIRGL